MLELVQGLCKRLRLSYALHTGSVPQLRRRAEIRRFKNDPGCRVFLSTDSGSTGLNLQNASVVINCDLPWNPARLEQRIGRVHRLGQAHPVHVVHLLTRDSIEERVWETMSLKKSLFAGVFDSSAAEVSFAALGRKSVLQAVKEIFANQPGRPKPVIDPAPPKAVPLKERAEDKAGPQPDSFERVAAGLMEAGVRFLESLAGRAPSAPSQDAAQQQIQRNLASLLTRDPRTNRPVLSIPLPESVADGRLTRAIAGILTRLGG